MRLICCAWALVTLVALAAGADFRVSNETATGNLYCESVHVRPPPLLRDLTRACAQNAGSDKACWADGVVPCDQPGSRVDIVSVLLRSVSM